MMQEQWTAHKFGGSSLSDADRFQAISQLFPKKNVIVIVSATHHTTEQLQSLLDHAQNGHIDATGLDAVQQRHLTLCNDLLSGDLCQQAITQIKHDCALIHELLTTTRLLKSYSNALRAQVLGYGEKWSALILTYFLSLTDSAHCIDASQVLYLNTQEDIDWHASKKNLAALIQKYPAKLYVITGFIARQQTGQPALLGRNGSDYSASIFSVLFQAKALTIWTDVDGVMSADPRKVPSAFVLESLSYREAFELAYFGAKVIHPKTITPILNAQIPLKICNSFSPNTPGTHIQNKAEENSPLIKGLSSIDEVALINIEGLGLAGVPGSAERVFKMLHHENISAILISQASSEHSICIAIHQHHIDRAIQALQRQFSHEIEHGLIDQIEADTHCAILAAVGERMVGERGIAAKIFHSLAQANVNIKAIAQGVSERNISVVIDQNDINRALRAVHSGLYLSPNTLAIGLIGPGLIGTSFLRQLMENKEKIEAHHECVLRIQGISNSSRMLLCHEGIDLTHWSGTFDTHSEPADLEQFVQHLLATDVPHNVIIDCTASQQLADHYPMLLEKGIHIITPNKKANAGPYKQYQCIHQTAQSHHSHYLYETTVCAGLPVIQTLKDLIQTGDRIHKIEGIVSGTLGYLFHAMSEGMTFSDAVIEAKKQGYTEPDPRDDLSGMDVARKMVCLAREAGFKIELTDVAVDNLVPDPLRGISLDDFFEQLPQYNDLFNNRIQKAKQDKETLRYVGCISEDGTLSVAVKSYPHQHPFSSLSGTDTIVAFYTQRYPQPLVIQGAGAGAEVTAAGVLSDLLRLISRLTH